MAKDIVEQRLEEISKDVSEKKLAIQINGYENSKGKKSNVLIDVDIPPYKELLEESRSVLSRHTKSDFKKIAKELGIEQDIVEKAHQELQESTQKSIQNWNPEEAHQKNKDQGLTYFGNNISFHKKDRNIYFSGKVLQERVIRQPIKEEKKRKKGDKTIAKDYFRDRLPNTLKRYKLSATDLNKLKLQNK